MTLYSLFLYIFLSVNTKTKERVFYQDKKLLVLALVIFAFFVIQKVFNPGTGEYENYNDILNLQMLSDWAKFGLSVKHFLTFLLFPLAALQISLLLCFFAQRLEKPNSGIQFSKENYKNSLAQYYFLCEFFPLLCRREECSFPFSELVVWAAWFRSFSISGVTNCITFFVFQKHMNRKVFKKVITVFLFLILVAECILLNRNFTDKYFRGYLVSRIQLTLSQDQIFIPPGKLQVVLENLPDGFLFRNYEANYISWKSLVIVPTIQA